MMDAPVLGIDVGKATCHAALLLGEKQYRKAFANNAGGYQELSAFLKRRGVDIARVCMEATGTYTDDLADFLHEAGHIVSVVNPSRIKAHAQSELLRTKTDRVDASLIARFCRMQDPAIWSPPAPEMRELQDILRRLEGLQGMLTRERNRHAAGSHSASVLRSIGVTIAHLETEMERLRAELNDHVDEYPELKRQRDLLRSIKGFGDLTALRLLAELRDIAAFPTAKHVVAFVGLSPRHFQSGSSVKGRSRIAKSGNGRLREALFFPAINAKRFDPRMRDFAARLAANGKPKMVIVCAVMRKLLHIAFAILRSGKPFTANYMPNPA